MYYQKYSIEELEKQQMQTFLEIHPYIARRNLILEYTSCYLYHGIRFGNQLEILENILKSGILAGKYIKNYSYYSDNCNNGEYVSLLENGIENDLEFDTFIKTNLSLIVSPFCEAYKTIYVPYEVWEEINKNHHDLKNRYSYARNEYQIKDKVSVDMIEAIGLPFQHLMNSNQLEQAEKYKKEIMDMIESYKLELPIVDTSNYNEYIYKKR